MASVEKAVISALLSDATVFGLVGDRIFPLFAPQKQDFPLVILQRVATVPHQTLGGYACYAESVMQVDIYTEGFGGVKIGLQVAEAIKGVLADLNGTFAGVEVVSAFYESEEQSLEGEQQIVRTMQEYRITFRDT